MKIFGMPIHYFATALIIGVIVAVGFAFANAPQPVDVHKTEITPVPTPAPVYVTQPAPTPSPVTQTWEESVMDNPMNEIMMLLPLGMMVIIASIILAMLTTLRP